MKRRRQRTIHRNRLRLAVIDVEELRTILSRLPRVHCLRRQWRQVPFTRRLQLRWSGTRFNAAVAASIADAVIVVIVDGHVVHVDIPYDRRVYIRDRAVVIEIVVVPVATVIATANISMPIVDAAVVADMRSPVAVIPAVTIVHPAPVAGCPQSANIRCDHPDARNPEVPGRLVSPISRRPEVVRPRTHRLLVNRQRRRGLGSIHRLFHRSRVVISTLVRADFGRGNSIIRRVRGL